MYQTWSNEIVANIYTHLCCSQLRTHALGFSPRSSLLTLVTAVWILQQSLTIHRRNCGNGILCFGGADLLLPGELIRLLPLEVKEARGFSWRTPISQSIMNNNANIRVRSAVKVMDASGKNQHLFNFLPASFSSSEHQMKRQASKTKQTSARLCVMTAK